MSISTPVFVAALVALLGLLYFVFASFAFGAGYQPAPRAVVRRMLEFAEVGSADTVYDLGAGTGAIVFAAARGRGARVVAVEVEPIRVLILRLRRWFGGPRERVDIRWGNLFHLDFRPATVVVVFLWPEAMARLRPLLEDQLAGGARVVSHWHPVPGWTPTEVDPLTKVYLYRGVAARVGPSGPTPAA
ncbi:MAG: class I SAM-dependent methyltransferase [Thermoplasmata archaeon]|nr:class I SAM-dependent methyltransferase [Thermoplasmata archaeon]